MKKQAQVSVGNELWALGMLVALAALVWLVIGRLGIDANWPLFIAAALVSRFSALVSAFWAMASRREAGRHGSVDASFARG